MALRGSPGEEGKPRFQFKLSRNMIIILGVFLVIIAIIVVLALVLPGGGGGTPVAEKTSAPKGATLAQVTSAPGAPTVIPPTQQGAAPTAVAQPTPQPPAPTQVGQVQVTSLPVPTIVPNPTLRPAGVSPTAQGVGGGEQALPATASGLGTWLVIIPVGILLLGVVAWWRWRRSRPSG